MKKLQFGFLLIGFLMFIGIASAQDTSEKLYKDKVITTNGSIIVGNISDYNPEESITIELKSGNVLSFSSAQIRKVVMYSGMHKERGIPLRKHRVYNESQLSFLTGESGTGLSFAHNVMFQYNKMLAFGIGAGVDNYYLRSGRDIFPIFANAKVNLTNATSSPYIGAKIGYGMAFKREADNIFEADGGFMANPYFGFRFGSRGLIFNMFSGLKFQKADYLLIFGNETRTEDIFFRRLEFGTSIMF